MYTESFHRGQKSQEQLPSSAECFAGNVDSNTLFLQRRKLKNQNATRKTEDTSYSNGTMQTAKGLRMSD